MHIFHYFVRERRKNQVDEGVARGYAPAKEWQEITQLIDRKGVFLGANVC